LNERPLVGGYDKNAPNSRLVRFSVSQEIHWPSHRQANANILYSHLARDRTLPEDQPNLPLFFRELNRFGTPPIDAGAISELSRDMGK